MDSRLEPAAAAGRNYREGEMRQVGKRCDKPTLLDVLTETIDKENASYAHHKSGLHTEKSPCNGRLKRSGSPTSHPSATRTGAPDTGASEHSSAGLFSNVRFADL